MDPFLVTGWRVENVVFLSEGEDIQELRSEEFTLEAETAISTAQGGSASMGLDLIYIVKAQTPDAINSIAADVQKTAVFNLNGQKVSKAQKGLFIINGHKVVTK